MSLGLSTTEEKSGLAVVEGTQLGEAGRQLEKRAQKAQIL